MSRAPLIALVVLHTAGCMVGPDYRRPDVVTPSSWGELKTGGAACGA